MLHLASLKGANEKKIYFELENIKFIIRVRFLELVAAYLTPIGYFIFCILLL